MRSIQLRVSLIWHAIDGSTSDVQHSVVSLCALWVFGGKQLEEVVKEVLLAAVVEHVWLGSSLWLLPLLLPVRQGSQGRSRTFDLALRHAATVIMHARQAACRHL